MPERMRIDPRRLGIALTTSFLAMPILVLDNLPARSNPAEAAEAVEAGAGAPATTAPVPPPAPPSTVVVTTTAAPTTTTTASPAPTTTAAPPATSPPPTAPPATPPTTSPPPPAEVAAPAAVAEEHGKATWYHWNPGECAHKTLPKGTVVTVTNLANGAATTCTVTDRGPYGAGRIIDLDQTVFDDVASLDTGVIDVVITW